MDGGTAPSILTDALPSRAPSRRTVSLLWVSRCVMAKTANAGASEAPVREDVRVRVPLTSRRRVSAEQMKQTRSGHGRVADGMWPSLVRRLSGGQEILGSNPGIPTRRDTRRTTAGPTTVPEVVTFGVWRSLAARSVRIREVAGSNPATPTQQHRPRSRSAAAIGMWCSLVNIPVWEAGERWFKSSHSDSEVLTQGA